MNLSDRYLRFLAGLVAVAAAVRLAWLLVKPALPALVIAAVIVVIVRVAGWSRRDRW